MYVDAYHDKKNDQILVALRETDGSRVTKIIPPTYRAYVADHRGTYRSIFGDRAIKVETQKKSHFNKLMWKYSNRAVFESDINLVYRALEDNYLDADTPKMNIGVFDIETDFDPELGYADPWNPFAPVTAITLHHGGIDRLLTLVLKPNGMEYSEAETIASQYDDTILFDDEAEMLDAFLELIDDIDVLTGWNSTMFDIPYMVNRVARVLGRKHITRFCLWGAQPKKRSFVRYKKEMFTYDLIGRVHLDYLELYVKHNTQQLHSYRLDFVGEIEVGENKVPYTGTLDELYNNEFGKFIEYNRQDVALLVKIDRKRQFIDLANQIAHTNCVQLQTTMGSVALIEQAITINAHSYGMVVPNRKKKEWVDDNDYMFDIGDFELAEDDEFDDYAYSHPSSAVGAYVAYPKVGIHSFVGAVDINSLYPSTLRSLNMSPETLIGQIRLLNTYAEISNRIKQGTKKADAWEGIFSALEYNSVMAKNDDVLTVDFEDGKTITITGKEMYDYIFAPGSNMVLSANGTIFSRAKEGIIPSLLRKWYSQRKEMQGKEKHFNELSHGVEVKNNTLLQDLGKMCVPPSGETIEYSVCDLHQLVDSNDASLICEYMQYHNLRLYGELICPTITKAASWKEEEVFWYRRQQARKILLNSLYGALLNESCKFYDHRLGQSVTLTGRSIARHMNSRVNYEITGIDDYRGDAVIYSDTDSSYFTAANHTNTDFFTTRYPWFKADKDGYVKLYDLIADNVNTTFAKFMDDCFNTSYENGKIVRAGREIVAVSALFIKKKKYACLIYDKEGERYDINGKHGKIKAMGLDLKRADTPKIMQDFLSSMLMGILTGKSKDDTFDDIRAFRKVFRALPPWDKGTPRKVNGISGYIAKIEAMQVHDIWDAKVMNKKLTIPGHVSASLNWNTLMTMNHDRYSSKITDGHKIVVCKLKNNPAKMKAVAYPIDQTVLPDWFKTLPFDGEAMEDVIIDKKINNITSALGWDLTACKDDTHGRELFVWD